MTQWVAAFSRATVGKPIGWIMGWAIGLALGQAWAARAQEDARLLDAKLVRLGATQRRLEAALRHDPWTERSDTDPV